jgi:NAD(P)-dependent dehydrogenase (short-subunit alcohol dehydrogenase family)
MLRVCARVHVCVRAAAWSLASTPHHPPRGQVFGSADWDTATFDYLFAVFVRGPALLIHLLTPALEAAAKASSGADAGAAAAAATAAAAAAGPSLAGADAATASVINISSVVAARPASGGFVPYAMTKAAVDAMTKGAADELAKRGIRVNSVSPGVVASDFMAAAGMPADAVTGFQSYQAGKNIPLGRVGKPEDVAALVSFLASPGAGWITGAIHTIDGGHTVRNLLA